MTKLTAEEIIKIVEDAGVSVEEFAFSDFENIEALGEWDEVSQYGGEGQGDTWYSVKYFKDHDVYIRTDGWYTSYDGTAFYDGYGYEVFPKEKVITVYEANR